MINKTSTRLPESGFVAFNPASTSANSSKERWQIEKMGEIVDVLDVVRNGSQRLHAITGAFFGSSSGAERLRLSSLDVAVATIGERFPLPLVDANKPDVSQFAYLLFNNVWGTNYPMWYPFDEADKNSQFRFQIQFKA